MLLSFRFQKIKTRRRERPLTLAFRCMRLRRRPPEFVGKFVKSVRKKRTSPLLRGTGPFFSETLLNTDTLELLAVELGV